MNTQQAAALLAVAAAFDNRKPDPDAATAWGIALEDYRFDDCRTVIVNHYRTGNDWLMPSHVIAGVKRIRRERLSKYGELPEPPPSIDPANTVAVMEWRRETTRRIADGEDVPRPALVAGVTPDSDLRRQVLALRRQADSGERAGTPGDAA